MYRVGSVIFLFSSLPSSTIADVYNQRFPNTECFETQYLWVKKYLKILWKRFVTQVFIIHHPHQTILRDPLAKHLYYISVSTIIQFLCIQFQLCAKCCFRALTIYMQFVFFLIYICNLIGIASFWWHRLSHDKNSTPLKRYRSMWMSYSYILYIFYLM